MLQRNFGIDTTDTRYTKCRFGKQIDHAAQYIRRGCRLLQRHAGVSQNGAVMRHRSDLPH